MKKTQKNVLFMIGYLTNGGAERSITNVANAIREYHNVYFVCIRTKNADYSCDAPIFEIPEFRLKGIKNRIKGLKKLKEIKKKYSIDVSISYTTIMNFYNVLTRHHDKIIISIRNHLSTKSEGKIFDFISKISNKLCNKIVCCSKSVASDQLINYKASKKKICVIENFCNEKLITREKKKKASCDLINKNTIVSMARLTEHKGHHHIIKAMHYVVKDIKDARLLIYGRGPYKEELLKLIKKYKLDNSVFLMDFDVNPFSNISKCQALILASDYEGFPNVIIEGMCMGLPIIATDSPGGAKEILSNNYDLNTRLTNLELTDYGILIPSFFNKIDKKDMIKNEHVLANAIKLILTDNKINLNYRKKSKERLKFYSQEIIINKWLDVINNE